ncbi:MAG: acetate kinase, partial [Proteobacteria bacterium]|nr:acetate kinase [Pseudomonadota bacterium]
MTRHVMTLNAGSSSIKFALFEANDGALSAAAIGLVEIVDGQRHIAVRDSAGATVHDVRWAGDGDFHADALRRILGWRQATFPAARVVAAGHRVVHGGVNHDVPVLITPAVLDELKRLVPLAPLHQPHNIAGILAAREAWPHVQQVACFDTAFHR